jgi:hypothetical protein
MATSDGFVAHTQWLKIFLRLPNSHIDRARKKIEAKVRRIAELLTNRMS